MIPADTLAGPDTPALPLPEVCAVLLAGGRSSRMGRDKALLPHPVSGRPLLIHQLDTLRAATTREPLLSLRHDQDYPQVSASLHRVRDTGDSGPLPALEAALAATSAPLLLALAVDLPFVTAGFLRTLLRLAETAPARGVVPFHPARAGFEPLCAVYPNCPPARAAFASARLAGRLSLQSLLVTAINDGWMLPFPLPESDHAAFVNWNRPADLVLDCGDKH